MLDENKRKQACIQDDYTHIWGWGDTCCADTGLSQIFQTTYDFLAGSVQQTISSASACTADTRAVEDRDDVYYQEEHQSSGERREDLSKVEKSPH